MKEKKLVEQLKLQKNIEVPYNVWRFFGNNSKIITLAGNQASFGEDYGNLEELRKVIEFYVDQLGGKVNWEK
jgi:hypothetical protein